MAAARLALLSLAAGCLFGAGASKAPPHLRRYDRRPRLANVTAATTTDTDYPYPPDFATGTLTTDFTSVPSNTASFSRPSVNPLEVTQIISSDPVLVSLGQGFTPSVTRNLLPATTHFGGGGNGNSVDLNGDRTAPPPYPPSDTAARGPSSSCLRAGNATSLGWNATSAAATPTAPITTGVITTTVGGRFSGTISFCESSELGLSTVFSTFYPNTVTLFGNASLARTHPQAMAEITPAPCRDPRAPFRETVSHCDTMARETSCELLTTTLAASFGGPLQTPYTPVTKSTTTTVFITAKEPTTVYSPISTPDYGGVPTKQADQHYTAPQNADPPGFSSADYGAGGAAADQAARPTPPPPPPVTLAVQPSGVVINGQTFSDRPAAPTQVVSVDGNVFTIGPTAVVGAGASVNRPAAPTAMTTQLGGLSVVISASVAVIDGTTFTIPAEATTVVVDGQTVSLGPGGVAVAGETVAARLAAVPTTQFVVGGDLVTAVGQSVVVIRGTTITYGSGTAPRATVVSGELLTIGPAGVVVHGTTLGGPGAKPGDTALELVGGATLTEIGASIVVIDGHTFTVGPGAAVTTTVLSGQTFTLGPDGVVVATTTLGFPFGPTTTFTPVARPTAVTAAQTSQNAAPSLRQGSALSLLLTCIAMGVQGFAFLLL